MLTVKHKEVTGAEVVYAAEKVTYQPRSRPDGTPAEDREGGSGYTAHCVFIETLKGEKVALGNWGTFYVMNDMGRTVATYELGGWFTGSGETCKVYPPISTSGGTSTSGSTTGMSLRHGPDSVTVTRVS